MECSTPGSDPETELDLLLPCSVCPRISAGIRPGGILPSSRYFIAAIFRHLSSPKTSHMLRGSRRNTLGRIA
nr:hypothetical protein CFP56_72483 [Quercus suber]